MSKILITGANGQLGKSIKKLEPDFPAHKFIYTDIQELDIVNKPDTEQFINFHKPDIIINCAAYNQVDKAEEESEIARKINVDAVSNLSSIAAKKNLAFIHVSTDYVFDGRSFLPYNENDKPNPLSSYAVSKFDGEKEALKYGKKSIVIRTSWLYSPYGHNFVKTIIKYGNERNSLNVVNDQVGTPTYAADLAHAILLITEKNDTLNKPQIFHFSNEGIASWYDFAIAIIKISETDCLVNPVGTSEYPLPAQRPYYSVLNKKKIKGFLNINIPHWLSSLEECINLIKHSDHEFK